MEDSVEEGEKEGKGVLTGKRKKKKAPGVMMLTTPGGQRKREASRCQQGERRKGEGEKKRGCFPPRGGEKDRALCNNTREIANAREKKRRKKVPRLPKKKRGDEIFIRPRLEKSKASPKRREKTASP